MTTNGQHSSDRGESVTLVEGVVEAVNAKGIKVRGAWHNVSQYRTVPLPEVGEYVRLKVSAKGFIDSVEIVKAAHDNGAVITPTAANRDRTISRLAVLKAAAEFGASRPDLKSADVLAIAQRWLEWIEAE